MNNNPEVNNKRFKLVAIYGSPRKKGNTEILLDKFLEGAIFAAAGSNKALIDRFQRFWSLKYEHKKRIIKKDRKGIFISTSGSNSVNIFDCPRKVTRAFFDVLYVDYLCDI